MLLFTGGGLNRIDCQLVELIFYRGEIKVTTPQWFDRTSKWSVSCVSSRLSFSSNNVKVSRANKWATCWASKGSMPERWGTPSNCTCQWLVCLTVLRELPKSIGVLNHFDIVVTRTVRWKITIHTWITRFRQTEAFIFQGLNEIHRNSNGISSHSSRRLIAWGRRGNDHYF